MAIADVGMPSRNNLIKLSTIYRREGSSGEVYYSGRLGAAGRLLLFTGDNESELVLYLTQEKEAKGKDK